MWVGGKRPNQLKYESPQPLGAGGVAPRPGGLPTLPAALPAAREHLLQLQHASGYWVGELVEADTTLAAGAGPGRLAGEERHAQPSGWYFEFANELYPLRRPRETGSAHAGRHLRAPIRGTAAGPLCAQLLRKPQGVAEIRQLWYAPRIASRSLGDFLGELLGREGRFAFGRQIA